MRPGTSQQGFSLLELLVASAIFFTFMVGMTTLFSKSHRSFSRGENRIQVQQSARIAVRGMAREIRMAGYDPSLAIPEMVDPAPIQAAASDRLTLIADVDGDDVTDRVTYRLDGDRLIREEAFWEGSSFSSADAGEVAEGIAELRFRYFDGTPANNEIGAPVFPSDLAEIHRVSIDLVAVQSGVTGEERFPLQLDLRIRNAVETSDESGP